jgi:hypothetical protein
MDANQRFIVSSISRKSITSSLNDYLENEGREPAFSDGDDRLTDAICSKYASQIGDLDPDWSEEAQEEELQQIQRDLLVNFGILNS